MRRNQRHQTITGSLTLASTVLPIAVVVIALVGLFLRFPAASALPIPPAVAWASVVYGVNSLIALLVYAFDKRAATRHLYRIPERTLHLVEFLGGWPGALIAQQVFRHKNRKPAFLIWTGLIVLAHVVFWIWMSLR